MAKVFLDTNVFMDVTEHRGNKDLANTLNDHEIYISSLSPHILFYTYKKSVPDNVANNIISQFQIVDLTKNILDKSLQGPTPDLEDNIQLHSASLADCDYFLSSDEKLLKMKFFGKTQIANHL